MRERCLGGGQVGREDGWMAEGLAWTRVEKRQGICDV